MKLRVFYNIVCWEEVEEKEMKDRLFMLHNKLKEYGVTGINMTEVKSAEPIEKQLPPPELEEPGKEKKQLVVKLPWHNPDLSDEERKQKEEEEVLRLTLTPFRYKRNRIAKEMGISIKENYE